MSDDFLLSKIGGGTQALEQARVQRMHDQTKAAQNTASKMNQSVNGGLSESQKEEVEKAATQFEGLLLHQLFNTMWKTVPQGGMLSGGREEQLYRDMLNQNLADQVASGNGIGLKDVILRELMQKYGS